MKKQIAEIVKLLADLVDSQPESMVIKSIDEEQRTFTAVVLEPLDPSEVEKGDLHNDFYTAEEVEKGHDSFNEHCMQPNVCHEINVDVSECEILKSFILPVPAVIGEQDVKAGSWIQVWKIHNDTLWEGCKDGTFNAFSIGCSAEIEDLE